VSPCIDAFIGIGSNLDDPAAQVRRAIAALGDIRETQCHRVSALYRNPPMGPADQPDYINAVAWLRTGLSPLELLAALQAIETDAGRCRAGRRWGPRPLDLDLLIYGQRVIDTPDLQVPHPGVTERAFVLYPLCEIDPHRLIPGQGSAAVWAESVNGGALQAIG
jgi:2-amino-4-hydroxy-6-hydroxymethyldihydropteridine diphosphokinase